jgi:hypothetical protein
VDYNIADALTDPPGYSEHLYTEKLAYMSKTFLCYPFMHNMNDPAFYLKEPPFVKNGFITFASFNNSLKFSNISLKSWAAILGRVPNSRLTIRSANGTADDIAISALKRRFEENGIDSLRVDFLPAGMFNNYLTFYNAADIILDTYPFNGATTTCDAFMMGAPVVSMYGDRHVSRVGLSMLNNMGLCDLAVKTREEYIETAVKLANDDKRLINLKSNLRETFKNSPLADCAAFKIEFECLMRKLHICRRMENRKKTDVSRKKTGDLVSEILRGYYFLINVFYREEDTPCVNFARNVLYTSQKELIKRLRPVMTTEADNSLLEKYEKITGLFLKTAKHSELTRLAGAATEILKILF